MTQPAWRRLDGDGLKLAAHVHAETGPIHGLEAAPQHERHGGDGPKQEGPANRDVSAQFSTPDRIVDQPL